MKYEIIKDFSSKPEFDKYWIENKLSEIFYHHSNSQVGICPSYKRNWILYSLHYIPTSVTNILEDVFKSLGPHLVITKMMKK